jgi:transcription initiation factor TFIID subunit TAF12
MSTLVQCCKQNKRKQQQQQQQQQQRQQQQRGYAYTWNKVASMLAVIYSRMRFMSTLVQCCKGKRRRTGAAAAAAAGGGRSALQFTHLTLWQGCALGSA